VKSLEAKDSQLKSLESKVIQLESTVTELKAKVQQQDSLLTSILREKNERTVATDSGSSLTSNNRNNQSTVAVNGLPSSCGDLKMIGHIWSGIYFVMGTAKMESVYCDFTKLPNDAGKCFIHTNYSIAIHEALSHSTIDEKDFRNRSDTPTSNRRPSISTSREVLRLTELTLRFRSKWSGRTRGMPWI
jgi:hypothetical protein